MTSLTASYLDLLQTLRDDVSYCTSILQPILPHVDASGRQEFISFVAGVRWLANELNYLEFYTTVYSQCSEDQQHQSSHELHEKWKHALSFINTHNNLRSEVDYLHQCVTSTSHDTSHSSLQ